MNRGSFDSTIAAMFSNPRYSNNYLFYAHLIGQCSIRIRDDIPAPAGVAFSDDHFLLYINPNLFDEYTLNQRLAILKHEMLHILYDHIGRKNERHHQTWNIATDCAINQQISLDDLPENCITPKTISENLGVDVPKNKSSEEYYDILIQDENELESDDHTTWEESTGDSDLRKTITKKMMETSQKQTLKSCGKLPKEYSEWLDINTIKSEVNWKRVLRNIIGNKKVGKRPSIKRFDRRFYDRDDLKGKVKDRTFELLVVADVSGSMSNEALVKTLSEVQNICTLTKTNVNLIQVDTKAHPPEKISNKTSVFQRRGTGGTELFNAISVAKDYNIDFDAVVIITDGYLFSYDIRNFSSLNKHIFWLIESEGIIPPELNHKKMSAMRLT